MSGTLNRRRRNLSYGDEWSVFLVPPNLFVTEKRYAMGSNVIQITSSQFDIWYTNIVN